MGFWCVATLDAFLAEFKKPRYRPFGDMIIGSANAIG
jgi:hypothetical protein